MKTLYIIRHGETDFNKQSIVQGSGVDTDINEVGKAQAQAFFEYYQHVHFDKIYISTLKRTAQTIEPFLAKKIPVEKCTYLNEISWGINEGLPISPERDAFFQYMIAEWKKGNLNIGIEGGETPLQVQARQQHFIDLILQRPEERTILICTHGRALRILLATLLNYPLSEMDTFEHTNTCLYKLHYTGSMFTVELANDTTHLQKLHNSFQLHTS
ncbi:MAG: histidine phosphatase family protein [Microscillaceae bacterium]|nr:histidine phosphatase family protein [Microscillaceae bacterium]MDW8460962.1 histidine phosphatase family protein [Cytophagales bacterium]